MHIPNLITTGLAALAALQGARAAPIVEDPPGVFQIDAICNDARVSSRLLQPMPQELAELMTRNYQACMQGIAENPRIFRGSTATGRAALCAARTGPVSGLAYAMRDARSEIQGDRERIYRQLETIHNPLSALPVEGHSLDYLRNINLHDYKHSGSTGYARQLDSQVALLRAHVGPEHRFSVRDARQQATSPACRAAWSAQVPVWARAEIAERIELVNVRLVGRPESISREQAQHLRQELAGMRLSHREVSHRMHHDALKAMVDREQRIGRSPANSAERSHD